MITKPSDHLKNDRRFKSWGKLITKDDIDLKQLNGYALGGQWVKWEESVSLVQGRWLVCAAETGSMKYHDYNYVMLDGNGEKVEKDTRIAALDQALTDGRITEDQRVKAKNSILYAFALYISLSES